MFKDPFNGLVITVYNNVAHDSWTETYENEKIYDWMLKFKKL